MAANKFVVVDNKYEFAILRQRIDGVFERYAWGLDRDAAVKVVSVLNGNFPVYPKLNYANETPMTPGRGPWM